MAKAKKSSSPTIFTSTLAAEVAAKFGAIPKKRKDKVVVELNGDKMNVSFIQNKTILIF